MEEKNISLEVIQMVLEEAEERWHIVKPGI